MASRAARIGQVAGWISLIGIFGYHLVLQALIGPPVSGTSDPAAIEAYYGHGVIAPLGVEQFVVLIPVIVFVVALREVVAESGPVRLWATVGVLAMVAEMPLIIAEIAAQAAMVQGVSAGADLVVFFRFWDVLYNSGTYVLEATLLGAFGLAFAESGVMPRWLIVVAVAAAAAQLANATAIWAGIPNAATMVGNVLFAIWLGGTSFQLGRIAVRHPSRSVSAPASASAAG